MKNKRTYEKPLAEIVACNAYPIMYEASLPQGGEGETGGAADSKADDFEEEPYWDVKDYNPWEN